jgi:cell wall-associated NlpC family hydrolase
VTTLSKNAALTITELTDGWYSVTCVDGSKGYVRGDLVTMDASAKYDFIIVNPTGSAQAVVDLAKQFLGVRYVYGGSGPKNFDCSGFTMYVCKQFGVSLPHSATSQWLSGKGVQIKSISAMQPGDLVFFCDPTRSDGKACSHCGIYLGNNQFIHASSSKAKVVISDLSSGYYNRYYVGGLRIF